MMMILVMIIMIMMDMTEQYISRRKFSVLTQARAESQKGEVSEALIIRNYNLIRLNPPPPPPLHRKLKK
jgi:hypothetical protein